MCRCGGAGGGTGESKFEMVMHDGEVVGGVVMMCCYDVVLELW